MNLNGRFLGVTLLAILGMKAQAAMDYVSSPDPVMTPGALCNHPDSYRFAQRIPYCNRDVDFQTKVMIIQMYDQRLGTRIGQMNRSDFKIDHLVPLCIGGSNEVTNLWPQHKSTFVITDRIEQITCDLVGRDRLTQNEAIEYVRQGKMDPRNAFKILERLSH